MCCKDCRAIFHTEYLDDFLKVIYKARKLNHDGGNQEIYSSESGLGCERKRKYAKDVNDEDSEQENDEDDGEDGVESDDDEESDEEEEDQEADDDVEKVEDEMSRYVVRE